MTEPGAITPPTVILFDWHATLVDTFEAMYNAVDDVLIKLDDLEIRNRLTKPGESKTKEDARLVNFVRDNLILHQKVKTDRKISRTDLFEILFDKDEEAKQIAHEAFNYCYRSHFGEIHPFEKHIDGMLEKLRTMGLKLGVLTNRNREFLEHEIEVIHVSGWTHLFDTTVCGNEVKNLKPAPDLILTALENLDVKPGLYCWYVGDSTTDTVSAKIAGVTNIFYNGANWDKQWLNKIFPGNDKHPHKPDAIVNDFKEFYKLVESVLEKR